MIKPRLNCFVILSTNFSCSSSICCLSGNTTISATPTVIPALDENLNPKSFIRSNIIDVSVMLNLLNTSAIILPKNFLLKGSINSSFSKYSFNPPSPKVVGSMKYLFGVFLSKFSCVDSLI
ncbi:Uncharacterised protein [Staphylococcus aureus]|nr:Uncharacterised protein [Staphylococcus aureus]